MIKKKNLSKLGVEGNFLNLVKTMYKKPTANIILKTREAFPLKSATRKGFPISPLLLNIILESLANALRLSEENYGKLSFISHKIRKIAFNEVEEATVPVD